jgi:replicative DNA helicase
MSTLSPSQSVSSLDAKSALGLRIPPHSIEAESSVLGGLLLDNDGWDHVRDLISGKDFYRHEHKVIFETIERMLDLKNTADVITVFQFLDSTAKGQEIGGLEYLNALAQFVPSASNIRRYAEIVREQSILRNLVAAGDEISTAGFNIEGTPVGQILDEAEQKIFNIGDDSSRLKQGFQGMPKLIAELIDHVQAMADKDSDITGLPTGFPDLDSITSGLQPGDLIILAARPSMGKTALAINIAENVALKEGLPVAVFSMEMGAQQLTIRVAGSVGRIDQTRLRSGKLNTEEWSRFAEVSERLGNAPLHIDDTPALTSSQLRASARRLARQSGGLGLIVVDYLQLMVAGGDGRRGVENRAYELAEITRGLKALAKELKCPVIALSQLSREVEKRTDKRPMMSDLRESGAIEQDADVIMFIYRDDYYNKESKEPGVAELLIAKQRSGPTGKIKLSFLSSITKFASFARANDDF